ncbi:MAG: SpoIIE family protein phosphatase [Bacteroidia bacterium]|nr:SpoIIE family protein phosphatase [Bacteroidia bacterium]
MEPGAADGFIPGIEAVKVAGIMSYALSDVKGRDDVLLTGGRQGLAVVVKHAEHVPGNTGWKTLTVIGGFPDEIISLKQDFSLDSIPVPDTLWKATSSKSQVPSSKSQVPSPKFQVSSPKSQILNSKSQIYSFWADFRYAGAALIRFNADFTKYAVQYFDTAHGLPTGVIQAFHLGASGAGAPMVVFGTDKGLFKYVTAASSTELNAQYRNRRTFSFVHDSTLGEFFVDTTVAVFRLANKNTDVWLTASKGEGIIKRVILTDNKTILDTIPFLCFDIGQINALCPDSGGIVWFGGADGIIRYDSRVRKNYKPVYHTLIRQVSVANDSVIFWGEFWDYDPQGHLTKNGAFRNGSDVEYDDLAGQASPYSRKITRHQPEWMLPTLAYKDNSITIQFAAPFFERPDKLVYSWQLEGYDTVWTKWKNENKAVYTNLGEGTYVFRVKAKNIYRHESTIAEYKFVIKPPWYRTWWAYSLYGLCLLLLLSLTALLFSWNLRRKNRLLQHKINRATASIRQQKEKIEELYGDITDSINYAKRIQQAVLPDLSKGFTFGKGETFMEHFIFFRPKDVVSGDFFWATFVSGYLVVAVVDCTGHGVPGAFMSMLGVSFLNEIVRKKEVTNAAMVLNQLRASIIEALKQTGEEGTQKDGMDMSLVAINISTGPPDYDPQGHLTKSGTFRNGSDVEYDDLAGRNPAGRSYTTQWAGANNPLWIIRNPDPQGHINKSSEQRDSSSLDSGDLAGQVIEIKPNKMPVAVHIKMDGFTNHEIQLNSGDKLYLFSDGYPDQFGGPKGKKFKYLAFKKLLAETSHLLMKEQGEQIEMALDKWMNFDGKKYEQIDDITVMGIKI